MSESGRRPERRRVVVTGAGALSPFDPSPFDPSPASDDSLRTDGRDGLDAFWSAMESGRTAFRPLGDLQFDRDAETDRLSRRTAAGVRFDPREHLDVNFRPVDRTGQMTIIAAQRALAASGWSAERRAEHEVGLVLGTMFGSLHTISAFDRRGVEAGPKYVKPLDFANSVINAAAGQAAIWLDLRGPNSTVTGGSVAGLQALGQACELIRAGRCDALLAGGAEELAFESFFAFQQANLVGSGDLPAPFDARRDGFVPGEGAAFLMLEAEETASARGAEILGTVTGHGTAFDPSRGRDPGSMAAAVARAIRAALEDSDGESSEGQDSDGEGSDGEGSDGEDPADDHRPVGVVSTGGSGLPATDAAEARGLDEVLNGTASSIPLTAVKSRLGECLGAGGAFQALAALGVFAERGLPGVAGWQKADPELPTLDLSESARAASEYRAQQVHRALLTSVSLDGLACAVVLERG